MNENRYRVNVVDALRGFAILGILLMHSYEQYNVFVHLKIENQYLLFFDRMIKDAIPFLFAGKAYAIFGLLFGFSFFIQNSHQTQKGADFRGRFLWRMVLLFLWGCLNSVFYTGDVLITFSLAGVLLVLTPRIPDKPLLWIAIFFLLQPGQWIHIACALVNPDFTMVSHLGEYYRQARTLMQEGNLTDMFKSAYQNQLYSFTWWFESGRLYQVIALFLFGILLGRNNMFKHIAKNTRFWIRTLITGILCYFPLAGLKIISPDFIDNPVIKRQINIILECYSSFALFALIVAMFILIYYHHAGIGKWLSKLEPYGKMSLTMYLSQSLLGGFVFYNWGLGLAPKLSITFSLLVGFAIFLIQYTFAVVWLKRHTHGPLEYIWKRLTWVGENK
ncbi:MAG: DUF418 domain-containing protein [Tannerella sp.]|jgi:uncharacterized protein|nr:DUF418 domain-containing protein [Tannerella sp.]